ncbi:hypothetical protein [Shinella zoogloeoides]|uniref:hypothetical protein n=1 Tax=Shinella zoogloeoides TaxID=352475 RepID=UPI00299E2BF4|nr:hypothetical protein [Shinella zoogloeoides]WPE19868.1 hypothetical protein ShzoTeo12_10440 [Shinella zoogloeoides]
MKYFIVKYVLSTGKIEEAELEPSSGDPAYLYDMKRGFSGFKLGRDAFATREEAVRYINETLIPKKIKSLRKSIAKLEGMKF